MKSKQAKLEGCLGTELSTVICCIQSNNTRHPAHKTTQHLPHHARSCKGLNACMMHTTAAGASSFSEFRLAQQSCQCLWLHGQGLSMTLTSTEHAVLYRLSSFRKSIRNIASQGYTERSGAWYTGKQDFAEVSGADGAGTVSVLHCRAANAAAAAS